MYPVPSNEVVVQLVLKRKQNLNDEIIHDTASHDEDSVYVYLSSDPLKVLAKDVRQTRGKIFLPPKAAAGLNCNKKPTKWIDRKKSPQRSAFAIIVVSTRNII